MTSILVTASAPNRDAALAMMAALGIAEVVDGQLTPLVNVTIGEVTTSSGARSLWNFWYYGASAEALMRPEPDGGWQPEHDLFERTHLLDLVDARTDIAMEWSSFVGKDGEPPGYETPSGVRLYDPSLIASPNLVKQ